MVTTTVDDMIDSSGIPTDLVEVRDDPVNGRGVYAKKFIRSGTRFCFYSGTVKIVKDAVVRKGGGGLILKNEGFKHPMLNPAINRVMYSIFELPVNWYRMKTALKTPKDAPMTLVIFPQKEVTNNVAVGQFIRQQCSVFKIDPNETDMSNAVKGMRKEKYGEENCSITKPGEVWIQTTKDVLQGQELMGDIRTSQSALAEMILSSKKPESRLMLMMLSYPYDEYQTFTCLGEDKLLRMFLHKTCGMPMDFLEGKDPRKIIEVLSRKIKGRKHRNVSRYDDMLSLLENLHY